MDIATGAAVADDDAVSIVSPLSSTGVSVAFKGVCVGMFASDAGQRGDNDNNVESASGKVGHKNHCPHQFDCHGQGDRCHCPCFC